MAIAGDVIEIGEMTETGEMMGMIMVEEIIGTDGMIVEVEEMMGTDVTAEEIVVIVMRRAKVGERSQRW